MSTNAYYRKLINSRKWQKLRTLRMTYAKYLCERCLQDDLTTIATEVHHVRPVETGASKIEMKALCYNFDNLQALCAPCHKKAHIELQSYTKKSVKERNKNKTNHFVSTFLKKP